MNADLKKYFSTTWLKRDRSLTQYEYSGYQLIKKVNQDEKVLDVGCGTNPFKSFIKNLHGIDITNVGADQVIAIEDFVTDQKYDVAFCLGSINFGSEELILKQIQAVTEALTPNGRIYWRCNPGVHDHKNAECNDLNFYDWSFADHKDFAAEFDFVVKELCWDGDTNRIYAEWSRI